MAQVSRPGMLRALLAGLCLAASATAGAAGLPAGGLQAEMASRWNDAIRIYHDALAVDPAQPGLWARVADIEARLGRKEAAVAALEQAARHAPQEAGLQVRLSQALAADGRPTEALAAINRAIELAGENADLLRARAQLATWVGDYPLAFDSYRRLLELVPADDAARLDLARVASWMGRTDFASRTYEELRTRQPEREEVWVESIRVEQWRGNAAAALALLDGYRERFGTTAHYTQERARTLASANRPRAALALLEQPLRAEPDNAHLRFSETVALTNGNRLREALRSLDQVTAQQPDAAETRSLTRFVTTRLRPALTAGTDFTSDTDDLDALRSYLDADYSLDPDRSVALHLERDLLRAPRGSGLERIDGRRKARHEEVWLGYRQRFTPGLAGTLRAGGAQAEERDIFSYGAELEFDPGDTLALRLSRDYDFYAISPRALSLGIRRADNRLRASWNPDPQYFVDAEASYATFSDDNDRWEVALAPRRAVLRTQRLNLDLGVSAWLFGFSDQPGHGYYDPDLYQRYVTTAHGYWKLSDDDGISVVLALGGHKDDSMGGFRFSGDVVTEGTFGLYDDWMLKVRAAFLHNGRSQAGTGGGDYEAWWVGASLTRRF
uniref:Tetratricopeptide repeat domain protein n=1 Tax=uncultured bacterium UPO43 TaxID=1776968 RepID=A0A126SXY8_9BACT|nr:tetratricopeptide repeat domain protein [uncultured bacterium UPO43]